MNTDVYKVIAKSIYVQQVYHMPYREVYYVRHGFARSECLANEGRNPLRALSRIESIDSKSHEVKHWKLYVHHFCSPRLLRTFNKACEKLGTARRPEIEFWTPIQSVVNLGLI